MMKFAAMELARRFWEPFAGLISIAENNADAKLTNVSMTPMLWQTLYQNLDVTRERSLKITNARKTRDAPTLSVTLGKPVLTVCVFLWLWIAKQRNAPGE